MDELKVATLPRRGFRHMISGVVETGEERNIQGVQVGDGWIANHFRRSRVISDPLYFSKDRDVAWKVLDGPFGKEIMESYVKKTGLQLSAVD